MEYRVLGWLQLNLWWILILSTMASKVCKAVLARFFDDETSSRGARITWFLVDVFDLFSQTQLPKRGVS